MSTDISATKNLKKILIIYPPISKTERYSSAIGNAGGNQVPLGIYYLSSYMASRGYDVIAIDAEAQNYTLDDILYKINEFMPNFIGISSTTVAFHRALELAEEIKKYNPKTTIILGGPHVTCNSEHALSHNVFDYGVMSEGEITLYELCECLISGGDINTIPGVVYRNDESAIVKTNRRDLIIDLDVLPFPAYDLVEDMSKYTPPPTNYKDLPVMSIITSRGCPGNVHSATGASLVINIDRDLLKMFLKKSRC